MSVQMLGVDSATFTGRLCNTWRGAFLMALNVALSRWSRSSYGPKSAKRLKAIPKNKSEDLCSPWQSHRTHLRYFASRLFEEKILRRTATSGSLGLRLFGSHIRVLSSGIRLNILLHVKKGGYTSSALPASHEMLNRLLSNLGFHLPHHCDVKSKVLSRFLVRVSRDHLLGNQFLFIRENIFES